MKYIRTKDMILTDEEYDEYFNAIEIISQSDTIEELMMIGDLVITKRGDAHLITNDTYIYAYSKCKSVSELFIKDSKGNYIRVAEENDKGELELL